MIMTVALLVTVLANNTEDQANPNLPVICHLRQPPKSTAQAIYQIFQQSKLKGCFWLLNKLTIITVAILSIMLLMKDLMAEEQHRFWEISVQYGILFILNSKLLVETVTKTYEFKTPLFVWLNIYGASLPLNHVGIITTNKYWIPVGSSTAAEFIIYTMGLNPVLRLYVGLGITCIFLIVMLKALYVSVSFDSDANLVLPFTFRGGLVQAFR